MNYPNLDGPVHHGQPQVSTRTGQNQPSSEGSPVTLRYSYHNYTGKDITVATRCGLKFLTEARRDSYQTGFVICLELYVERTSKRMLEAALSRVSDLADSGLRQLRDVFLLECQENRSGPCRIVLEYQLTLADLIARNGSVYHHDTDVMISLGEPVRAEPNPYSHEGRMRGMVTDVGEHLDNDSLVYQIRMVDNEGATREKFTRIGNFVYGIKPITDPTVESGIYVTSHRPRRGDRLDVSTDEIRRYPLNEESFKVLGMLESFAMAKQQDADATAEHQLRMAEIEREAQTLKTEVLTYKERIAVAEAGHKEDEARHRRETMDREEIIRRNEAERERIRSELKFWRERAEHNMQMDRMYEKDRFEDKSSRRKDISEALKVLPAIILGVGGLIAIIKSLIKSD